MITFEDLIHTPPGTVPLDWDAAEALLGFPVHAGLKDFYSRVLCGEQRCIKGTYHLDNSCFLPPASDAYADWISLISGDVDYELYPLCSASDLGSAIQTAFEKWTGGYDMGRRALIGSFYTDVGDDFLLLFNQDTGAIELNDPGYGHFEVYEENPYGIFAENLEVFYLRLSGCDGIQK